MYLWWLGRHEIGAQSESTHTKTQYFNGNNQQNRIYYAETDKQNISKRFDVVGVFSLDDRNQQQ